MPGGAELVAILHHGAVAMHIIAAMLLSGDTGQAVNLADM